MIYIFNGNRRGPHEHAPSSLRYIQVTHDIMPYLKMFGASDWLVFSCLALHMDGAGFCFPSLSLISNITGLSIPTVRRCIDNLCDLQVNDRAVLSKVARHDKSGRQTTNGYILFPDAAETIQYCRPEGVVFDGVEGVKTDGVEGVKSDTPTTLNKNQKYLEPKGTKVVRTRKQPTLPEPDDIGRLIFEAYRSSVYPELDQTQFTLGEWIGARHIVYQMAHRGITPEQVRQATTTLIMKWGGKRDIVTLNALWKHWSAATTGAAVVDRGTKRTTTMTDIATDAMEVFRRVNEGME
jgi:hypothetical protein